MESDAANENAPLLVATTSSRGYNIKLMLTIAGALGLASVIAVGIILATNGKEPEFVLYQLRADNPVANSSLNGTESINVVFASNGTSPSSTLTNSTSTLKTTQIPSTSSTTSKPTTSTLRTTQAPTTTEAMDESIQVEVDQGTLQGKRLRSRAGREYLAFLGIPYAKSPVGDLRFKPPVAADPWEGIWDATYFRSTCIEKQRVGDKRLADQPDITIGSEDCLYLNVYTPKNTSDLGRRGRRNRLPVLFYIHGGAGGAFGTGQKYGADYFMDENVVLVTLEFRIGILGNLNTNTSLASGNQGMKDQVMALQWVQDNIQKFGGDRRKVTIFGNSFGGIQVTAHMLSPMSDGLFHRAIAQSGTLLYPGFFTENPLGDAKRLGETISCPTNATNEELTQCLNATDASILVLQSLKLKHQYNYIFTISVDSASEEGDVFLAQGPLDSLEQEQISTVPFMTGIVDSEGLKDSLEIMINNETLQAFNSNFSSIIVPTLYFEYTVDNPETMENITTAVRDFYFENHVVDNTTVQNLTNMFTDRLYLHPAMTVATFLRDKANSTGSRNNGFFNLFRRRASPATYLYYFSHEVEKSRADPAHLAYDGKKEYLGECHADELQFFFPFEAFPYIGNEHQYYNFSRMVVKLWTTFADTGIPSGAPNNWTAATQESPYQFFEINDEPRMMENLTERISFWNQFELSNLYM